MSVTLSEVKRAARAHRAPLAGESAGYLVLALADQVLSAPRTIAASDVQLTDDGGLRVLRGEASSETDAELSLRRALDSLLLVASSGSAALMRAGRRVSPVGLPGLVRELEAALIPVNRAAARRALARLQRETARALASGTLAAEEPEKPEPAAPNPAPADESHEVPSPAPAVALSALPEASEAFDSLSEDLAQSDALTIALDVRTTLGALETALLDEEVVFLEDIELVDEEPSDALTLARNVEVEPVIASASPEQDFVEEPSDALTVARNVEVEPVIASASPEQDFVELSNEACTRPEPVILRRALRPLAHPEVALPAPENPACTPTLGSLAAELPVLAPELIAELTRRGRANAASALLEVSRVAEPSPASSAPLVEVEESVLSSEFTEPMPEVIPLSHGVAIVASRQSDVSELLAGFGVAPADSHHGLRRAIKELAELDLTPAPFTALIR